MITKVITISIHFITALFLTSSGSKIANQYYKHSLTGVAVVEDILRHNFARNHKASLKPATSMKSYQPI